MRRAFLPVLFLVFGSSGCTVMSDLIGSEKRDVYKFDRPFTISDPAFRRCADDDVSPRLADAARERAAAVARLKAMRLEGALAEGVAAALSRAAGGPVLQR